MRDREAVEIFAENLKNLILAAPLGTKPVIGIDPGLRTGCKCAAVDPTVPFAAQLHFSVAWCDREGSCESDLP